MTVSFLLVRHGATKMNNESDTSADRIRGWKDVPLAKSGREEVENLAEKLKDSDIDKVYSSDLERAKDTAEGIVEATGAKLIVTKALRPWDLGDFAGQSTKEALPKIATYVREKPDEAVPEGESFNSFKARAFAGLKKILDESKGEKIAVVTHHRIERLIKAWIAEGAPPSHEIDLNTFLQKGEAPGNVETITIPKKGLTAIDMATVPNAGVPAGAKRQAAGVLFVTPDGDGLFVKRQGADHAGEWSLPAGHVEDGETFHDAAEREAREEVGFGEPPSFRFLRQTSGEDGPDFATFRHDLAERFDPELNDESSDYVWAPLNDPPVAAASRPRVIARGILRRGSR